MSEKTYQDYLQTFLQYRRTIAFGLSVIGVGVIDLTVATYLPFWLSPVLFGIIAGIIIGSAYAGLFAALGAMVGRLISIIIMVLTMPGALKTADLFLAAIGDVLGAPLPPGSIIVVLLSIIICGLFGLLGGFTGGSATKITKIMLEDRKEGN
ncbi:MAG: hypothetical protein JSU57_05975 [Candidatus Heimdallarchaeota archaeon]|nr:MAG: hypothetical protein JSU57_05975 [Candidatus Heimdallarchaeota archaeon]